MEFRVFRLCVYEFFKFGAQRAFPFGNCPDPHHGDVDKHPSVVIGIYRSDEVDTAVNS